MLRALDPDHDYQPKSKNFVPTAEERKKFTKQELEHIEQMIADDEQWQIARVQREQERGALLQIARSLIPKEEGATPRGLSRRT